MLPIVFSIYIVGIHPPTLPSFTLSGRFDRFADALKKFFPEFRLWPLWGISSHGEIRESRQ
jgi:hypothetical protein